MKSKVLIEEDPLVIRVFEEPEVRDMIPWLGLILALFVVTGFFTYLTQPELLNFALFAVIVISVPFFVNRFILQRGNIGGESFRIRKYTDTIVYKSRTYAIDDISIILEKKELTYQNMYQLFLISDTDEIKLRSDFSKNDQDSICFNIAKQLNSHFGLQVERL